MSVSASLLLLASAAIVLAIAAGIYRQRWIKTVVRARNAIAESESRIQTMMQSATIAMWELEFATGKFERSEYHDKIFGYDRNSKDWSWDSFITHIHPKDRDGFVKHFMRAAAEKDINYSAEFRIIDAKKKIRWLSSHAVFMRDESGRTTAARGLIWDVTDLKRAQEAAEMALQAKSHFLANISHELRTPLGAILGFHELIKENDISPRERERYFAIIERNGHTLSRLIDDLLELSRIESGAVRLEKNAVDLRQLVTDVVLTIESTIDSHRDVKIHYSISDQIPIEVTTDLLRVRQIITNLLSNAVKFTPRGEITLEVHLVKGELVFDVLDSGPGIPHHIQDQLFQPFQQGDTSVTRRYGGSGLGLALSRQLARLLQGDVVLISSQPGKGSHFRFTHPLIDVSEASALANPRLSLVSGHRELFGVRILVVDDSMDNQILIERALAKRGAQVILASNGMEAITAIEREPFDIVLMDMQMPVMDGMTATRHLRASGLKIPIVALTAHAMAEQKAACIEAGCNDHVAKPVDFRYLASRIVQLTATRPRMDASDLSDSSEIQLSMSTL